MSTAADAKRARARLLREGVPWWLTLHILNACETGIDRTARQAKRAKALGTTFTLFTLEDVWRNPNTCPMDVQWISDKLFWFESKKRQRILDLFMKDPTIRKFYADQYKKNGVAERFASRGETFDVDAMMTKRASTVNSLEHLLALEASSGLRSPVLLKAYIAACDKGGVNFRKEVDARLKSELKHTSDARVLYWETLVNAWWQTGKRPSWKQIVKEPE